MLSDQASAQEIMRRVAGHVRGRPSKIPRGSRLRIHVQPVAGGGRTASLLINGKRVAGCVAPPGYGAEFESEAVAALCEWWDAHAAGVVAMDQERRERMQ